MFLKKLEPFLLDALDNCGYTQPTEVQKTSIPKIKSGVDLFIKADEGTGKTTAIVITVIQQLKQAFKDVPRALIVTATREKSEQMKELFQQLAQNTDLRVFCEADAGNLYDLRDKIYAGSDVVIATAKKLNELYAFSGINLNNLKMFIVDDAELIMREQILSEINRLAPYIPKSQRIVCCSRFTNQMNSFEEEYMNFPHRIEF